MSNGSELKGKSAVALRAAGYLPLPRYWVTREQMDLIMYMVRQNEEDVTRIRVEANGLPELTEEERKKREVEKAWRKMKAGKEST